ncbi:hypothetical protein M3Y96_00173500 [Aphelenchoides besseyi]|nr:hypothetical protein M3Y96_00173500 [Aphelenchoides besseyi]
MEIVLESRAVNHIGEIAILCDALDVLESLEYISLRLNELNNNSTNSLAIQLMYCLPDKIVEFRGFLPEIVAYFAQRKPLALFFVPWNQKPFDLANLLQINAQRIVFDQQFDLTTFNLEASTSLMRPNPVIRLLECDVKIAPFYITINGNQTDVDLDQVIKTLAIISVLSPRPFLKLTSTQMQIEPPEVIKMLEQIVSDANYILNEMTKLGVPLKLFHLTPLLSLDSMLISNSAWMDELVAILIERFDLADYSMEGKTCQIRGQVRDLLLTITITEFYHYRDPDGTHRKVAKELVRKFQSNCENE